MSLGKKRWAALALLLMAINLVFSACGDNTATPAAGPNPTAQSTTAAGGGATPTAASNGQVVELNVLMSLASPESGPPPADWPVYQIVKDKLGINLKLNF